MRFVWAVAAFVLAAVMIGAGIAQRTVFQGPKSETVAISVSEDAPYLLIDGAVLNKLPGAQTLRAQGEGEIFAAYGRTADIEAWLADTTYNEVTLTGAGKVVSDAVAPTVEDEPATEGDETAEATPAPDSEAAEVRSPIGSDLWLDEFQQEDLLIAPLQLPEDMSVIVATDGEAAAPSKVSVSWAIASATPWAGPLIVAGGILMAIGVFLYILGIRHARRSRGPRRKGLPLAVTEPIDLAVDGADKGVISATPPTRRSVTTGKRAFVIIPAVAVSALLFAGCSADSWPQMASSPTPSPTETVIVPEGQQAPGGHQGSGGAHHLPDRLDRGRRRRGDGRDARRDPPGWRGARRAFDELPAPRCAARRAGAGGDPDQAARDRPAAGVRRMAALGDGRRER